MPISRMPTGAEATVAYTIVSLNYLPYARVLMESIAKWHPGWRRVVVLADKPRPEYTPERDEFEIIPSTSLGIPRSSWFHFRYNILELNTAVKPYAMGHLLETHERVFYFDPDILVTGSLEGLERELGRADILLTPHLLEALPDDGRLPDELTILKSGSYNLGFIAVRASECSRRFVQWWQSKLYRHAHIDFEKGLFTDQRWIDLVPSLFPSTSIIRDPAYNVAYWNLGHRDPQAARFFHFSGFDPHHPERLSKFQTRFRPDELGPAAPLLEAYGKRLLESGYDECRSVPYGYATFDDGSPVLDICRRYSEAAPGIEDRIPDAFSAAGKAEYLHYWNEPIWTPTIPEQTLTRFAVRVHSTHPGIAGQMPDPFGEHYVQYLQWLASSDFPAPLREPIQDLLRAAVERHVRRLTRNAPSPITPRLLSVLSTVTAVDVRPDGTELTSWLNEPVPLGGVGVPRLASLLLLARPDLQGAIAGDPIRLLRWFITSGAAEYDLPDALAEPARHILREYEREHRSLPQRLTSAISDELRIRINRRRFRSHAMPEQPASFAHAGSPVHKPVRVRPTVTTGVNVIGYIRSEHGIGEGARGLILALKAAGVPVSLNDFETNNISRQQDARFLPDNRFAHDINICCVNADQTEALFSTLRPAVFEHRYNIGYWAWELERFPDQHTDAFRRYDEIWVPSTFCLDAIARVSPVPVLRVPHCIQLDSPKPADAKREFTFVSVIDVLSVLKRKNPGGLVDAFERALPDLPESRLIIKINNGHLRPAEVDRLRRRCSDLPVTILDQVLSREALIALLASADCVVSLHRSEGFGLVLAEAMYLGKPVIATGYSGNLDFTRPDTSFLVPYEMVQVGDGAEPYPAEAVWAEPCVDAAVEALVRVGTDPEARARTAARGRRLIRDLFSPEAVGRVISGRMEIIRGRGGSRGRD